MAEIVLASASPWRRAMLEAAGVPVGVVPAAVDEPELRRRMAARPSPPAAADVALELACAKALEVAGRTPKALVIGADQVLAFEGEIFGKPASVTEARTQLARLRGKEHALPTAVALARGGDVIWRHVSTPRLVMRRFTDAFLEGYLAERGDSVTATVGAYEIEGRGAQLFEAIVGDYFSIVGLPLLPLLAELRRRGFLLE